MLCDGNILHEVVTLVVSTALISGGAYWYVSVRKQQIRQATRHIQETIDWLRTQVEAEIE